ncbi:SDR family NAD(P)-dependent oxidoreductase [Pusillimonas sp. SM2304]|uniref:SDR family NAD(P)-dependent oxidoreductase n=1 Tax=Pusillimonas sp. SM2304 TaxID=3073241 RepID=UPI002875EDC0|nr:SDR family NAD(P)-dependent oxidoreductase [Pusillimonas sp. SM2304]MDS1140165.1 SDR family NAD(P)-dependent oxidoreductase [Pusillimonas sp. SM2304]
MSQVWFITGSGRGIGAEVVRAALQAGHQVVATGRNLAQLQASFPDAPAGRIAFVELDVAQEAQAEAAVSAVLERFGRIDVLVNNAGYGLMANFEEVTSPQIEHQFATNVFGLMHVMRAVLPVMRRQRSGRIFNISSVGGALGFKGASVYCATKYAVEGLSASVAMEVAPFGIKVTAVEPGFFRTDFLDAKSVKYSDRLIEDYSAEGTVQDTYEHYNHQQAGDPAKLGAALVKLAGMPNPPKQFLAGSDAVAMVTQSLDARLGEVHAFAELSRSTDGVF